MNTKTKVTKDGFVFLILDWKLSELYKLLLLNKFELFALHDDDSESLIDTYMDIFEALECGLKIGIEVDFIEKILEDTTKKTRLILF